MGEHVAIWIAICGLAAGGVLATLWFYGLIVELRELLTGIKMMDDNGGGQ